jgi:hypothetical protein
MTLRIRLRSASDFLESSAILTPSFTATFNGKCP